MLTSLLLKYPDATVQKHHPSEITSMKIWFTNANQDEFIGINASDLTQEELKLLRCLFKELSSEEKLMNESPRAAEWLGFLFKNGPAPSHNENEYRVIQFTINEQTDVHLMKEAFKHLLPLHTVLVMLDEKKGLILEEKNDFNLDEEQLLSISHVIESDFFVSMSFFIGQFQPVNRDFIHSFKYEIEMVSFSEASLRTNYIQSVVTLLPSFMLKHLPIEWKEHIFSKTTQVFSEDTELIHTVKAFLENQSNISQTAKKLFMHRNSVQYRIDKFIEKTTIDIKTFQGALLAYLAVLEYESDNLPKK
ncbi:CdaR family transcriptional regulator [Bacillus sp. Marseille-Q1617]|uniref:PucR family transcriptional regulator n=1 Tax=Bacillus sp. Marseille-Q1617 TaxID=2736887 RepID=UPI00158D709A|nr:helix-turn-helix domain-containing protein [Bacillus sp. Marseille-Q1617]